VPLGRQSRAREGADDNIPITRRRQRRRRLRGVVVVAVGAAATVDDRVTTRGLPTSQVYRSGEGVDGGAKWRRDKRYDRSKIDKIRRTHIDGVDDVDHDNDDEVSAKLDGRGCGD
jgi:hypothetical protein